MNLCERHYDLQLEHPKEDVFRMRFKTWQTQDRYPPPDETHTAPTGILRMRIKTYDRAQNDLVHVTFATVTHSLHGPADQEGAFTERLLYANDYLYGNDKPSIFAGEYIVLHMLAAESLSGEGAATATRFALHALVEEDEKLRKVLATTFPDWWRITRQWLDRLTGERELYKTTAQILATYPEEGRYVGYTPHEHTIEDAADWKVAETRRRLPAQIERLSAQIDTVTATAPPAWIRVLKAVTHVLKSELRRENKLHKQYTRRETAKAVADILREAAGEKDA
jgi:hypothetical protein